MFAGPAVSAFVTSIVFTSLSFIVVALRLYTRIIVVGNVGVDDYLIPAALVSRSSKTSNDGLCSHY